MKREPVGPVARRRQPDQPLRVSRGVAMAWGLHGDVRPADPDDPLGRSEVVEVRRRPARRQSPGTSGPVIALGTGAAAGIASLWLVLAALTPQIHPPEGSGPPTRPQPVRTAHSDAPVHPPIDKRKLIIMQNVNCWLGGQPGATCGPERTYR